MKWSLRKFLHLKTTQSYHTGWMTFWCKACHMWHVIGLQIRMCEAISKLWNLAGGFEVRVVLYAKTEVFFYDVTINKVMFWQKIHIFYTKTWRCVQLCNKKYHLFCANSCIFSQNMICLCNGTKNIVCEIPHWPQSLVLNESVISFRIL